jgi:hypothetical protein
LNIFDINEIIKKTLNQQDSILGYKDFYSELNQFIVVKNSRNKQIFMLNIVENKLRCYYDKDCFLAPHKRALMLIYNEYCYEDDNYFSITIPFCEIEIKNFINLMVYWEQKYKSFSKE